VVINEQNVILAGHSRVKAAKLAGEKVMVRIFYPSSPGELE